ncbi:MAG: ADP compounds hydrolase NudE [Halioglobus sp.]
MKQKPVVIEESLVAQSRFFHVQERLLRFRSGEELRIERLLDGGHRSVVVVAMLDEERFILIREYAAGVHGFVLSLPMGGVGENESVEQAARRELAEEVGYTAQQVTHLQTLSLVPSHLQHTICVCVATGLSPADAEGDEFEPIVSHSFPFSKLLELTTGGEFTEARSIAAVYMARDWLASRKAT